MQTRIPHYLDIIAVIQDQLKQAEIELDKATQVLDDNNLTLFDHSNPAVIAYRIAAAKFNVLSDTVIAAWEATK